MTPFVYCPNLKKFNALVYPLRDNFDEDSSRFVHAFLSGGFSNYRLLEKVRILISEIVTSKKEVKMRNLSAVLGFDRNHCAEMRTLAAPTSLQVKLRGLSKTHTHTHSFPLVNSHAHLICFFNYTFSMPHHSPPPVKMHPPPLKFHPPGV